MLFKYIHLYIAYFSDYNDHFFKIDHTAIDTNITFLAQFNQNHQQTNKVIDEIRTRLNSEIYQSIWRY